MIVTTAGPASPTVASGGIGARQPSGFDTDNERIVYRAAGGYSISGTDGSSAALVRNRALHIVSM